VRVDAQRLRESVAAIFRGAGVSEDDASQGADVLVAADLRGVETHGVSTMLRGYLRGLERGWINPRPQWQVIREFPGSATIDCDRSLGLMIAPVAMRLAIAKARQTGLGAVAMRNSQHLGMAAYHAMLAAEQDMVGICVTATPPAMLPTFGGEIRLGTNPMAVAAPAGRLPPFVYDAATSVVAASKLGRARRSGLPIPGNWVADLEGRIISEPGPAPEEYHLLPLGSTPELGSYKGYGLAMIVEILASLMSGASPAGLQPRSPFNHFVAAFNIAAFTDLEAFKGGMDSWLEAMQATPPAPGYERVLTPGQAAAERLAERTANGIPLSTEFLEWLRGTARELGVGVSV
jgi:LDH2 family malate/lactate/ureidoglycolate dehydrogenase